MNFTVGSAIKFGWETFKKRPWFFILVFLVISILSSVVQVEADEGTVFTPGVVFLLLVAGIVGFAIQMLIGMGKNQLLLRAHHDVNAVTLRDLWAPHPFWKFLGAYLLMTIVVVFGLILLIIPGIIWGLKYMFAPLIVMDKKMRPFEALKESARITDGHKWDLLLFVITLLGVNILGLLCLIVGLLVTIPVTSLAFVHAYRALSVAHPQQH